MLIVAWRSTRGNLPAGARDAPCLKASIILPPVFARASEVEPYSGEQAQRFASVASWLTPQPAHFVAYQKFRQLRMVRVFHGDSFGLKAVFCGEISDFVYIVVGH